MLDMTATQTAMGDKIRTGRGFIAALDQSGGSTPKALALYGVPEDAYSGEGEMFDLIHDMRARIINAPTFTGDKVIGAILFEMTMDRQVNGKPTATTLWDDFGVVPFLKIDKGLEAASNGVKLMKPMPHLSDLLPRARNGGIFGTKMRAVIDEANQTGIDAIVDQQFQIGAEVLSQGLVPILEPEITITMADKARAEDMLMSSILKHLDAQDDEVMLKLTLPETPGQYQPLVDHPKVMKVVALSGGYDRTEANARLAKNTGIVASFSRALTEGLSATQSDAEFNTTIAATIDSIHAASVT
ncbi:fructose bisphosphate aldolase [Pseudooctadecabacter sp.]|uniref:fructose bisphosphate aldolase n=1 Tax=Pseudooctadecabacter sp. TaxID=1966338 RepID=UPI0035C7B70D